MALFERTFGKKHPMTLEEYRESNRMHTGSTKVEKGEDWSNADGDRHGMYNQDTDEGGMGKKHTGPKGCKCGDPKCKDPKCKKREVRTGHGAEKNDAGEVHWSGSGSPYPKLVKARLKLMDIEKKQTKRRRKLREEREAKEQAEFDKEQEKTRKRLAGETEHVGAGPQEDKRTGASTARSIHTKPTEYPLGHAFDQEKEYKKIMDEEKEREEGFEKKKKKKKKDVEKSAEDCFLCGQKHTYGTSEGEFDSTICDSCVNHLAAGEGRKISGPTKIDDAGHEVFKQPPKVEWKKGRKDDEAELIANDLRRSGHPKFKTPKKTKKSATITNIHSRLKSLDFLLRGRCHIGHKGSCADAMAEEKATEERDRNQPAFDKMHKKIQEERKRKKKGLDPGDDDWGRRPSKDWREPDRGERHGGRRPDSGERHGGRRPPRHERSERRQGQPKLQTPEEYDKLTTEEREDKKLAREGKVSLPKVQRKVGGENRPSVYGGSLGQRHLEAGGTARGAGKLMALGTIKEENAEKWKSWLRKQEEKQGTSRIHQAEQKELDQAMGTVPGQTDVQTTTRRLGIGRGAARFSKKDGEFGGMNTGETEWTEPRDTANSRTKRDKDVA